MEATRQDAWTEDEDMILAKTVIRHIQEGKTQLEAFKEVAKQLSRTSAACGFRWNATIRKKYYDAIESAKKVRKQIGRKGTENQEEKESTTRQNPIETAISMLEALSQNYHHENLSEQDHMIALLKKENDDLKKALQRYQDAWKEMHHLWEWVQEGSDSE